MTDHITRPRTLLLVVITGMVGTFGGSVWGATLEVGPAKQFARIEEANAKARPSDVILVYPLENAGPYEKTAVYVRQKDLTFRAVPARGSQWVKISGGGFDYSGRGSIPRAIFQFNQGADGCVLEGFELFDAHNHSHNGAGVRINQANHVTIRNCHIHGNDMGIMSNGDGKASTALNQNIQHCRIHHNGSFEHPGYNHNLYLGGTSVTLSFCEVHSSLTGHNVKSRAGHTRVEYCYVHHSANREFDLVDSAETARPDSHAVIMGNIIVKDPKCKGNRGLLHFGQDGGGQHQGTVYLLYNTIVTPFISPVVQLSASEAKAHLVGNLVSDGGARQSNQRIAAVQSGARLENVTGAYNWFSGGFSVPPDTGLDPKTNLLKRVAAPMFANPSQHDYRLTPQMAQMAGTGLSAKDIEVPATPGLHEGETPLAWQYHHPAGKEKRPSQKTLTLGAYGAMK